MGDKIPNHVLQMGADLKAAEDTKRLYTELKRLNNRLTTCQEQRSQDQTNFKDLRTVQHFELIKRSQEEELESIERYLETITKQFQQKKESLLRKKLYVDEKLSKAQERLENQKKAKSKEELNIEKQMSDIITEYDGCINRLSAQMKGCAWGLSEVQQMKTVLGKETSISTPPIPPTPPPLPPPLPVAVLPDEPKKDENPLAKLSDKELSKLSQSQIWSYLHPGKPNPYEQDKQEEEEEEQPPKRAMYPNVILNTKAKRVAKKVDG
jgi:hypothetical protein